MGFFCVCVHVCLEKRGQAYRLKNRGVYSSGKLLLLLLL